MSRIVDVLEYAMQMEKDGECFYRELSEKTTNKGLRTILTMLADEEIKHYNAIEKIKTAKTHMTEATVLGDAKNVFVKIRQSGESFDFDQGQIELYKKAQDIEEKSQRFYLEKASHVEEEYQRELFLKLAEEEKKHYFLLDNIIEFVCHPENWLEDAEFYRLEEY